MSLSQVQDVQQLRWQSLMADVHGKRRGEQKGMWVEEGAVGLPLDRENEFLHNNFGLSFPFLILHLYTLGARAGPPALASRRPRPRLTPRLC